MARKYLTVRNLAEKLHEMHPDAVIVIYSASEDGNVAGAATHYPNIEASLERHYFKGDGWEADITDSDAPDGVVVIE